MGGEFGRIEKTDADRLHTHKKVKTNTKSNSLNFNVRVRYYSVTAAYYWVELEGKVTGS